MSHIVDKPWAYDNAELAQERVLADYIARLDAVQGALSRGLAALVAVEATGPTVDAMKAALAPAPTHASGAKALNTAGNALAALEGKP